MSYEKKKVLVIGSAAQTKFNYKITEIVRKSDFSSNIDFLMIVTNNDFSCQNYPFERMFYLRKGESIKNSFKTLLGIRKYDVIVYNGIFFRDFVLFIMSIISIGKKKGWIIWGGDVYRDFNLFRKMSMKVMNFNFLGLPIPQDLKILEKKLGAFGGKVLDFWFPNAVTKIPNMKESRKSKKHYKIMIGNSSTESNQHVDVFIKLMNFKNQNFSVVLPLAYGDANYKKYVIEQAYMFFGKKRVEVIGDFMPADQYMELLSTMDFLISNHNRQQGGQNILLALALGVAAIINPKNIFYDFLSERNVEVNSFECFSDFKDIYNPSKQSVKKVREMISEKYAKDIISRFFYNIITDRDVDN